MNDGEAFRFDRSSDALGVFEVKVVYLSKTPLCEDSGTCQWLSRKGEVLFKRLANSVPAKLLIS
jgi:hypothetical protein